ncbi:MULTISPECIES: hypothetical protein [unclassified Lacinutrix]
MIKRFTIIGICFLFLNCASLPKYESENLLHLTEKNITQLNGTYSNYSENSKSRIYRSFLGRLTSSKIKDSVSEIKIEVLNSKEIRFLFLKNQKEIHSKTVKYKLQNDGFLLLKNRNFRLHGIPWILGDYEIRKYEIGLSNSGNLVMNGVEKREGAFLIIFWGPPGKAFKFTDIYSSE